MIHFILFAIIGGVGFSLAMAATFVCSPLGYWRHLRAFRSFPVLEPFRPATAFGLQMYQAARIAVGGIATASATIVIGFLAHGFESANSRVLSSAFWRDALLVGAFFAVIVTGLTMVKVRFTIWRITCHPDWTATRPQPKDELAMHFCLLIVVWIVLLWATVGAIDLFA